ncbi:MAG: enoyl-CoA hydratase/isomerase family protein, partial [Deltaproteobacteria bacterium]|nr:enoyl-CoA hydratase/isomerase family protein [Deltaproteobacteria bacterium]
MRPPGESVSVGNTHDPHVRGAGGPILGRANRKKQQQDDHVPAGRDGTSRVKLGVGKDGVAVIRVEGADGMTFLGPADIACLLESVDKVAENPSVRALILAGGENFSAGTDFPERMRHLLDPGSKPQVFRFLADQKTVCDKIRGLRIPTVSVVRGLCAGSALGLAAAADFLITDSTTRIRLPEVKVGLIPGNGATWFLPRRMGPAAARYFGLTASSMSGKQAVALGLAQGYAGADASDFIAELQKAKGPLDRRRIQSLLEKKGGTPDVFREEVRELSE